MRELKLSFAMISILGLSIFLFYSKMSDGSGI